jgi:outer membrane protein TolC
MQAVVETARANVALSEALLKLANSQKNSGTGTGIEVTRAEVQLANDRQSLLVAETDFEKSQLQLLRVLGFDLDAKLELTDRLSYSATESISVQQAISAQHARAHPVADLSQSAALLHGYRSRCFS